MRKRVFGSIFLTSLVTLLLTTGLLLLAVHAGLTNDMRQRLVTESSYLSAVDNIREELEKFGSVYADRLTLVAQDGTVLYDNRTNASEMENHAVRPEIAAAEKNGTGEDNRLSETFAKQTFYYAVRLKNGDVLRISATADSVFGALSSASPWIVLIILLALLVAALLAGRLTGLFLKPIEALDLHEPMKGEAYDELSPLLHRMDKQNRKIQAQMDELQRRQAEFDDITARMDEGLVLFSGKGMILFANHAARALFPHDSAEGSYLTLCRDANYIQVVEQALDGKGAHGKLERNGRIYELTASSVEENSAWHAAVLLIVEKLVLVRILNRLPAFFRHIYALFFILLGWVLFRTEDFSQLAALLRTLFTGGAAVTAEPFVFVLRQYGIELLLGALLCTPLGKRFLEMLDRTRFGRVVKYVLLLAIFALALLALVRSGVNAFIYAQF